MTPMTKAQLLAEMRAVWDEWQALMAQVGEARMTEPGATGVWSVRDVMAHLASYSRWFVNAYDAHKRGENVPMDGTEMLDVESKNQTYHQRMKHLSLDEVRAEWDYVYHRLLAMVETESEEFLTQPQQFAGSPMTIIVWQPLQSEVYKHTRDHMTMIRDWLTK
ncbi:MAG: ClbS/DfsB family four-helix bundle protein [Anaerolineae bacterium]